MSAAPNFETFIPQRRGRQAIDAGPTLRLTTRTTGSGGGTLRLSREALALIGLDPKKGDHYYFILDVDRQTGAIRLTPTDDTFTGRLMNPTNRQITLSRKFFEWTGWDDSRWPVEVEAGALVGSVKEPVRQASIHSERES